MSTALATPAAAVTSVAYLTDAQGQRTAVLVPYAEWLALQQELQASREEALMRTSLTEAFRDIADMEAGRKPKVLLVDFLAELRQELAEGDE